MNNINLLQIPSASKIRSDIRRIVFGKKMFCPRCGSPQVKRSENRYRCRLCRKPFSLTSHTWLKGMKISLRQLWLLLWCWARKIPLDQAASATGLSRPTTRKWYEKFRDNIPQAKLENVRLEGIVQMDEAYRGGKKRGYAIIGAKEQKQGGKQAKIAMTVVPRPSVDRKDALEFITNCIKPNSRLQTDGNMIYRGINNRWPLSHEYERHNHWEFSLTSEIEGLWGELTTFIRRVYHHVTKDKIGAVIREFLARKCCPEWFYGPTDFLAISLTSLPRPKRPEWRGKYQQKFSQSKGRNLSIAIDTNQLSIVPSC